jgi:hypothetical protein
VAVYETGWRVLCWVLGIAGLSAAILLLPPGALAAFGLIGVLCALGTAIGYGQERDADRPLRRTRGQAILVSLAAVLVLMSAMGLTAVAGDSTWWLFVVLAAASPPAVRWFSARLGWARRTTSNDTVPTAELCRRWRDSYEALREASTPAARLRIVMERERCLDELERRDADGLNAWLGSSATAAGDPSSFLTQPKSEPPADA